MTFLGCTMSILLGVANSLPMASDMPMIVSDDSFRLGMLMLAVVRHAHEATDDDGEMRYAVRIASVLTVLQVHRL